MIQIQIILDIKGNDKNDITLNILEREDANDKERELARYIEELHLSVFSQIQEDLGEGEVVITKIG